MNYLRDMRVEFDNGDTVLELRGNAFIVRDPSGCLHLEREQILRFVSTIMGDVLEEQFDSGIASCAFVYDAEDDEE